MKITLIEYHWAQICYNIHEFIGYRYPRPVNGLMVKRYPFIQKWLARQIPYESW